MKKSDKVIVQFIEDRLAEMYEEIARIKGQQEVIKIWLESTLY